MLDYGFVTLAQFKQRFGISAADTTDDAMLQRLINDTAGMLENAAGRTLRRDHARTEYFRGGEYTIRVACSPIAKIHSIRESETRDFTTSGSYTELVDGTDYVVDEGQDGMRPGETGVIRRLGSK